MKSRQLNKISTLLIVGSDMLMSMAAFVGAHYLRLNIPFPKIAEHIAGFHLYLPMIFSQLFFIAITFFLYRLYHQPRALSFFDEFYSVFGAVSISFMMSTSAAIITLKNSSLQINFSRGMLIYAWMLSIVLIVSSRGVIHRVFRKMSAQGIGHDIVLIVGTGDIARIVLNKIKTAPALAYKVIGLVSGNGKDANFPTAVDGVPVLGFIADIPRLIRGYNVDEIIIALPEVTHPQMLGIISQCDRSTTRIRIFPDIFLCIAGQVLIDDLGGLPLLSLKDIAMQGWRLAVKRGVDIMGSLAGLIILSPLMAVVAMLIKLDSRGPIFYSQERMGLDARPFRILKFRSMRQDAEAFGPNWTKPDDPRRTRIGAKIRRLNIDELPQLVNVLLGQMSLVGPRAERPYYVEQFQKNIPGYMHRHKEKAGMTGWAQVNGLRGDTSIEERTKYDLWYIEHWSLFLDFKIILRQIFQLFRSKNAY